MSRGYLPCEQCGELLPEEDLLQACWYCCDGGLQMQVSTLQDDIMRHANQIDERDATIRVLRQQKSFMIQELRDARRQLKELESEVSELSTELEQLKEDCNNVVPQWRV